MARSAWLGSAGPSPFLDHVAKWQRIGRTCPHRIAGRGHLHRIELGHRASWRASASRKNRQRRSCGDKPAGISRRPAVRIVDHLSKQRASGTKALADRLTHGYLGAPYSAFGTTDGFLALAMTPLTRLANALHDPEIAKYDGGGSARFDNREIIHRRIAARLRARIAKDWELELDGKNIRCARALTWDEMLASGSFLGLHLVSSVASPSGAASRFIRAQFKINGKRPEVDALGPELDVRGMRGRRDT